MPGHVDIEYAGFAVARILRLVSQFKMMILAMLVRTTESNPAIDGWLVEKNSRFKCVEGQHPRCPSQRLHELPNQASFTHAYRVEVKGGIGRCGHMAVTLSDPLFMSAPFCFTRFVSGSSVR